MQSSYKQINRKRDINNALALNQQSTRLDQCDQGSLQGFQSDSPTDIESTKYAPSSAHVQGFYSDSPTSPNEHGVGPQKMAPARLVVILDENFHVPIVHLDLLSQLGAT